MHCGEHCTCSCTTCERVKGMEPASGGHGRDADQQQYTRSLRWCETALLVGHCTSRNLHAPRNQDRPQMIRTTFSVPFVDRAPRRTTEKEARSDLRSIILKSHARCRSHVNWTAHRLSLRLTRDSRMTLVEVQASTSRTR